MESGVTSTNQVDSRIVISYRRDDTAGYAGRLDDDLSDYFGDNQVFRDLGQIDAGTPWLEAISRAIACASAVVVVIGPQWAKNPRLKQHDDVVRNEVAQALSSGKPVFPVLVGNAHMPTSSTLPPELAALAAQNAIQLSEDRWRYDVTRLIDALARIGIVPSSPSAFPDIPSASKLERRGSWLSSKTYDVVCRQLIDALNSNNIRSSDWQNGEALLDGGNRTKTRLIGGFWVKGPMLPTTGRVRVIAGPKTRVDVLLRENLGGAFMGMTNIYTTWFDQCLADLQRATQGN